MQILFPLNSGFSNIPLVKAFRANKRQPVRLVKVDMASKWRFPDLCVDGVMRYCLPYNMKILTAKVKQQSPQNRVALCAIPNTGRLMQIPSSHSGYWSNLQTRFLIWNHYVNSCWQKRCILLSFASKTVDVQIWGSIKASSYAIEATKFKRFICY